MSSTMSGHDVSPAFTAQLPSKDHECQSHSGAQTHKDASHDYLGNSCTDDTDDVVTDQCGIAHIARLL
eukprot:1690662-Karenia_brevis.AAC.1